MLGALTIRFVSYSNQRIGHCREGMSKTREALCVHTTALYDGGSPERMRLAWQLDGSNRRRQVEKE